MPQRASILATDIAQAVDTLGSATVPRVRSPAAFATLEAALPPGWSPRGAAGLRGLAAAAPPVAAVAHGEDLLALVRPLLGPQTRLVRSILFVKTPTCNWQVAWHQDLTITVAAKAEVAGFGNWSIKATGIHVQPPETVLQGMVTVRLHLDETDAHNGALWVAPKSHHMGRIPAAAAAHRARQHDPHACPVSTGGALVMRPLLLHASFKATAPRPRRVIHLEYAAGELPNPLRWAEDGGAG
ncbi:MAG: phytanoyl-CoA dioxygenase family protein [Candidatus Competibacterales bacterium]